jgi:hypothetical protein
MRVPRVYVDTSVIAGCLDQEFLHHSERLRQAFASGLLRAVISDITIAELDLAPARVRALLARPGFAAAERVKLDQEADSLAEEYIRTEVVSEASRADAEHIAVATVQRADILVSWNFRHIVRLSRIRAFNAVNLRLGYPALEIRSPLEIDYE